MAIPFSDFQHLGLGDALRVGPQVLPAAVGGVPIVQRGPHGMRFSPFNPIVTGAQTPNFNTVFYRGSQQNTGQLNVPQQVVTGVMGLGQATLRVMPSDLEKIRISLAADRLVERADSATRTTASEVLAAANGELVKLNTYQRFESSYYPIFAGGFYSSQTIRAKLQDTTQRMLRLLETGKTPASRPTGDPNPVVDAAFNLPQELGTETLRRGQQVADAGSAVFDAAGAVAQSASDFSKLSPTVLAVAAVGAVALLSFAYGAGKGLTE